MADQARELAGGMPTALDTRHLVRRVVQLGLLATVTIAAVATLPGLGDVRERFAGAQPGWLGVAAVFEAASMLGFVAAFRGVFCRRMSWRFSAQVALSEQAANVLLPAGGAGGLALGAWALRRGGMPTEHIARRSVAFWLVTSSPNFLAVAGIGLAVATGVLSSHAGLALALVPALLAVATIAVVLSTPGPLRRAGAADPEGAGRVRRGVGRVADSIADGVEDAVVLLRRPAVAGGAVAYLAFDIAVLVAAFHAFGGTPAAGDLLLAYLVGQLGGLIPVPGGIGGTDGGLVAALALFGTPLAAAAAAVLAYRVFQLGMPAIAGAAAFVTLRRTLARDARPAARCAPMAEAVPA
jgi:uncharacterized membrane protein YbhN (UPF0104 family)